MDIDLFPLVSSLHLPFHMKTASGFRHVLRQHSTYLAKVAKPKVNIYRIEVLRTVVDPPEHKLFMLMVYMSPRNTDCRPNCTTRTSDYNLHFSSST